MITFTKYVSTGLASAPAAGAVQLPDAVALCRRSGHTPAHSRANKYPAKVWRFMPLFFLHAGGNGSVNS